ncbi:MAG: ribosome small subunit-dependent GTPase A, partial [Oscillospiraceae bacterium]|nr:ribosome small subunit-dependent GTPase A [Oscillospiraceae bacterium]
SIKDSVSGVFADIEEKLGNCRFSNCLHQSEPGCIIREAIELGEIDSERWESYQKLQREALYAENKHEAIRQKSARNKDIAVWSKSRRKAGKVKW